METISIHDLARLLQDAARCAQSGESPRMAKRFFNSDGTLLKLPVEARIKRAAKDAQDIFALGCADDIYSSRRHILADMERISAALERENLLRRRADGFPSADGEFIGVDDAHDLAENLGFPLRTSIRPALSGANNERKELADNRHQEWLKIDEKVRRQHPTLRTKGSRAEKIVKQLGYSVEASTVARVLPSLRK